MAKLRQLKDGSSYYIRSRRPNYVTWTVRPAGVEYLKLCGIEVDSEIAQPQFQYLQDHKLVFTGGSGVSSLESLSIVSESTEVRRSLLRLRLCLTDRSWNLTLWVPSLSVVDTTSIVDLSVTLAPCKLHIDESTDVLALTLWPGSGGMAVPVPPHEQPYRVRLDGPWPLALRATEWAIDVGGISHGGVLFDAESGDAFPVGSALAPDDDYLLLLRAEQADHTLKQLPSSIYTHIGVQAGWSVYVLCLGELSFDHVQTWFRALNYRLATPKWRTTLVSPAQCLAANGTPIYWLGETLVLAIVSAEEGKEGSKIFMSASLNRVGDVVIGADRDGIIPSHIAVRRRETLSLDDLTAIVPPLSVNLATDGVVQRAHAWDGNVHTLSISQSVAANVTATINCPTRVTLVERCGAKVIRHSSEEVRRASERLTDILKRSSLSREALTIEVDAGSFGVVQIAVTCVLSVPDLAEQVQRQARWFVAALRAADRSQPCLPLPARCRAQLRQLAKFNGCQALAYLSTVPRNLLPMALHIAHRTEVKANG